MGDPLIECIEYKYDLKIGLKDYFDKKRRLGALPKLNEQIISLLIHGLPKELPRHFVVVRPKSFAEFYRIGKSAEDFVNLEKEKIRPFQRRTPSKPCPTCDKLGKK